MKPVVGTKCFFFRNWHVFQNSSVTKTPIILSQQNRSFGPRATAFRLSSGRISNSVPHVKPHDFWDHEKNPACTQRTWLGKNSNFGAPQQLDSSGLCRATSVPKTKNFARIRLEGCKKWPQKSRWINGDRQYC